MQKKTTAIILASGSPRRRELLSMICHDFSVVVSDCEEIVSSAVPEEVTIELSRQKAQAVAAGRACAVVIGADTVVSIDGEILGKPRDREDAPGQYRGDAHTDRSGRGCEVGEQFLRDDTCTCGAAQ